MGRRLVRRHLVERVLPSARPNSPPFCNVNSRLFLRVILSSCEAFVEKKAISLDALLEPLKMDGVLRGGSRRLGFVLSRMLRFANDAVAKRF
jgi:hypothetical protein